MQKKGLDVQVHFKEETHRMTVDEGSNYEQLARSLKLNPEEVLVFVNGIPMPSDERVKAGEVHIVKIVSGG